MLVPTGLQQGKLNKVNIKLDIKGRLSTQQKYCFIFLTGAIVRNMRLFSTFFIEKIKKPTYILYN